MKAKFTTFLLCLCSILLIVALSGCSLGSSGPADAVDADNNSATTVTSKEEQFIDETVFPKDKVVDVKIKIDEADFQDMLDNASAEEMKTASVDYNGEHFDNIGVRTKGNLSLKSVVSMTDSDRYSLKLSFDEYVNQTLGGISKINLNNNYSDASYMREFLSYELAEQMGLPTPKYSYVNVYINDKLWGFYLAVEQIGNAYLERNFGNAYGALYKANGGTGSELNWLEDLQSYTGLDLKSESSNDDVLLGMLDELNNGTDIESVLDVDEALKFIALNAVAGNMDSYLSERKHNYYLYEDDGIFSVLPWDYNMSFAGGGSGFLLDEPTSGTLADRPLVDKLLQVDAYKEKYHTIVKEMIEGYLSETAFADRTKQIAAMISSYVKADPSSFYTYEEYEQGITQVVSVNKEQTSTIAQQLDGTIASSGDGSGSGGGGMGGMGRGGKADGMRGGMGGNADRPAMGAAPEAQTQQGGQAQQTVAGATAPEGQGQQGGQAQQGADGAAVPDAQAQQGGQAQQGADGAAAPDAQAQQGGQAQQGADGAVAPDAQGQQGGQAPPDGFGGGMQGGGGMGGGPGGMQGGGFGGGFGGGAPGAQTNQQQGSTSEAIAVGIAVVLLLLSCLFIAFYKRKRL